MHLPNFIIIGSAKAATSSLFHYIAQHPEVSVSKVKETNFFAWDPKGMGFPAEWDKDQHHEFPATDLNSYASLFECPESCKAIGEASPVYLDSPLAALKIRETLPQVKLIVSVREPVSRIFSDYKMQVRFNLTTESLEAATQPGKQLYELGFAGRGLKRFYDLFPREQILAIRFEDINDDLLGTLHKVWEFIGVDPFYKPEFIERQNVAPKTNLRTQVVTSGWTSWGFKLLDPILKGPLRSASKQVAALLKRQPIVVPPAIRKRLQEAYREDSQLVAELTGLDLDHWFK